MRREEEGGSLEQSAEEQRQCHPGYWEPNDEQDTQKCRKSTHILAQETSRDEPEWTLSPCLSYQNLKKMFMIYKRLS